MKAFVYILVNENRQYYIGSTNNLPRRLQEHRTGGTQTTRNRKISRLAFSQSYDTLAEARKIERWLKNLKRRDFIEKIVKDGYIKKIL